MKIKLKTLNLMTFDINKRKQFKFVDEMKDDPLIREFVTAKLDHYLIQSMDDEKINI